MTLVCRPLYALTSGLAFLSAGMLPASSADLGGSVPKATEPHVVDARSPWTFKFTTYGWLPWLTGQQTVKGRTFDVQVVPDQILSSLDWSTLPVWMSYAEARNGKLALYNDITWSALAGSASFAVSRQGAIASQTLSGAIAADYQQAVVEVGAAYEIWSSGASRTSGATAIDALAGLRYWHQSASLSASLQANIGGNLGGLEISGGRVIAKSGGVDWVDPVIGARIRHQLAPGQNLMVRADVGGFGAGSDLSWQAIGTFEWQMLIASSFAVDAYLGYRALSVDYAKGSGNSKYEFDVLQHGPVMGATVHY